MSSNVIGVPRWVAFTALAVTLVAGGVLGIWAVKGPSPAVLGDSRVAVRTANDPSPVSLGSFTNGFSAIVKPALPAVVNISSSKIVKAPSSEQLQPFFNDPAFRQFFGDQFRRPRNEREQSLGSGVIVSPDGYLITNNHVVDGATDIKVSLSDRRDFKAKLIGTDPKTDIAVLKIEASGLPSLTFGDSSKVQVGDVVFAIGDPFGIGETATMGIVSATNRGLGGAVEGDGYEDFIQTDAAINHGNSGGALVDLHGNLVGINTAILPGNDGGNQGIGFAIPINMAHGVMDQLIAHGKVIRGYLGVYIQSVTPELAKSFGLANANGALIGDVTPNSAAAKAGIQKGDVVTELNGEKIETSNELRLRISQTSPGTAVHLKLLRDGKPRDVSLSLDQYPEKEAPTASVEKPSSALEGVEVEALTSDIAEQLNLPAGVRGVVVTSVDPSSSAAAASLRRGDVIQEVNHKPVANVREYEQAVGAGKGSVLLLVNSGGVTRYIAIEER